MSLNTSQIFVNHPLKEKFSAVIVNWILRRANLVLGRELTIHDPSFYSDVLLRGSLGLGESYMQGKWSSPNVKIVVDKIIESGVYTRLGSLYNFSKITGWTLGTNYQCPLNSIEVIEQHYDLPPEVYEQFLDPFMQYTCAYYEGNEELDKAQEKKMSRICEKLGLSQDMNVLDIGGGGGGLAEFMRVNYDVTSTVLTLSQVQANYIKKRYPKVSVIISDYRSVPSNIPTFDRISSVGMLEHVGHLNYSEYMGVVKLLLKDGGIFLLHSLYAPEESIVSNPWLDKYIFPNGELAPKSFIEEAGLSSFQKYESGGYPSFEELTTSYPKTLLAWNQKFTRAVEKGKIDIPEEEIRKWHFYFMFCASGLDKGRMKVGQFLFQKGYAQH